MHEMSLTENVIDILAEEGRKQGFARVRRVWLEVGVFSHVEPEALRFCFDVAARGTLAEGAGLEIVVAPGEGLCRDCAGRTPLTERFGACVHCGGRRVAMTRGAELRVKELEVE